MPFTVYRLPLCPALPACPSNRPSHAPSIAFSAVVLVPSSIQAINPKTVSRSEHPRILPSTSTAPCPPAEKTQRTRDGHCDRGKCRM